MPSVTMIRHASSCRIAAGFLNCRPTPRRRQGQWDQSESYFNEAERLDPRNVYLLTQHAQIHILLRRFPEAAAKA